MSIQRKRQLGLLGLLMMFGLFAAGPAHIQVSVQDYFGAPPAGVGQIASALGLQMDGEVTGLFAGQSLTAMLGPGGAGKSTLLGGHGFLAGEKVRITNTGGGKLKIERVGGAPLTIHVHFDDFYSPQGVQEITTALGVGPTGQVAGLFEGQSLTARIAEAGKSSLLGSKGFATGDRIKITSMGNDQLKIERVGTGGPLTLGDIHVGMQDFFRAQAVEEMTSVLGLAPQGKVTGLLEGQSLTAVLGAGGAGQSTLLFDRGYLKGQKVRITNAGGGTLKIERVGTGGPLSAGHIQVSVQDYFSTQAVEETTSALGLNVQGKVAGLFEGMSLTAVLGAGGADKSTLLGGCGFSAGYKVKVTNVGGGTLKIERLGPGAPLSMQIGLQDFWSSQGMGEVASALGVKLNSLATGLFQGMSLTAVVGPRGAGKSTLLGARGFASGDMVKLTNAGGSRLQIERLGPGTPLTIHISMDKFFSAGR